MVQTAPDARADHVGADATVTVSLGKGAWDCDKNVAIPPEKEVLLAPSSRQSKRLGGPVARLPELSHACFRRRRCLRRPSVWTISLRVSPQYRLERTWTTW